MKQRRQPKWYEIVIAIIIVLAGIYYSNAKGTAAGNSADAPRHETEVAPVKSVPATSDYSQPPATSDCSQPSAEPLLPPVQPQKPSKADPEKPAVSSRPDALQPPANAPPTSSDRKQTTAPAAQQEEKTFVPKARWHQNNLERHWEKHCAEFPEFHSAEEYGNAALDFFQNPPKGTLTKRDPNGDYLFYYPPKNNFGVTTADGTPKTFFRPSAGIKYWNRQ